MHHVFGLCNQVSCLCELKHHIVVRAVVVCLLKHVFNDTAVGTDSRRIFHKCHNNLVALCDCDREWMCLSTRVVFPCKQTLLQDVRSQ